MMLKRGAFGAVMAMAMASAGPAQTGTGATPTERPISFALFGDSGYIPSYERPEADEPVPATLGAYLAREAADWLERNPSLDTFRATPWVFESAMGGYLQTSGMYPVARGMEAHCRRVGCDFAAMLGDNIYPDGATLGADGISDARRFDDMLARPFATLGADVPDFTIYAMMGNHDWHISRKATEAQLAWLQKHPKYTMPGYFYRAVPKGFEGRIEIFVIDTEMLLAGTPVKKDALDAEGNELDTGEMDSWPGFVRARTRAERDMVPWLEDALRTSTAKWKIVMGHHALWSGGGSKYEKARSLRALLLPAICRHADAYISGDDHMLEVYTDSCQTVPGSPAEPLPLFVSGAASKYRPLHPKFMAQQARNNPQVRNLWSKGAVWGFMHARIEDDTLTMQVLSTPDVEGGPVLETEHRFRHRSR